MSGIAALLLAGTAAAVAADMPVKAPLYKAPPPVFDWTGFYLGAYVGVAAQQSRGVDPTGATAGALDYTGSGPAGGLTLGYNLQFSPHWVAGVEGDIGYLGLSHDIVDWNDFFSYNSKTSSLGTLRGRVGYASGPTLNYVTGGGAFVGVDDSVGNLAGTTAVESKKTLSGYTYGSGVETMLGGNWTAKAEYLRVVVGNGNATLVPASIYNVQVDHHYSIMKFGVNYLFGGKPQAPLPAHSWGGFYVGAVGGSGVLSATGTQPGVAGGIGDNGSGFTLGGLVGYDWQFASNFVAGVAGDFSWFGIDRSLPQYNDFQSPRNAMLGVKTNWISTARARFGYSTGPALLYVTGGGAWVNLTDSWQGANGLATGPLVSNTKTLSGFAVGGGIETVFLQDFSWRTEYLYADVGSGDTLASTASMNVDHKFHLFRTALTYHFGR